MVSQNAAQPVIVQPWLAEKPWGSGRLAEMGIVLPGTATIGEALYTAPEATVVSGDQAGLTLGELARSWPEAWVGGRGLAVTRGEPIFPLLVKLIDAGADLSIQVHPNDEQAAAANLCTGKTEAWHILSAREDSVLFLGLLPDLDPGAFASACSRSDGGSAHYLRQLPARPGMTIVVPAGTPHAIGAGILLYEVQQPSNVTFRLDDWGRVDERGNPRELHLAAGIAALDPRARPEPIPPLWLGRTSQRQILAATRYFALEKIALRQDDQLSLDPIESPRVLTSLSGNAWIDSEDTTLELHPGQTAILPSYCGGRLGAIEAAVVLHGWVPDLELEVIAPAMAAGATREEVERLGIMVGR